MSVAQPSNETKIKEAACTPPLSCSQISTEDTCWGHGTNLERHDTIEMRRILKKEEHFHAFERVFVSAWAIN